MILEYPPRPEGSLQEQVEQLWRYLFMLVEKINAGEGTRD